MAKSNIFSVGGTVQARKGIYLSRQADKKLLELCQQGEFTYILTSRQMGKSSLMISTASELKKAGVKSVIIDLTRIGTQVTVEQWYLGLLLDIEEQLRLDTDVEEWWQVNENVGFTQRLTKFFQHVLLEEVTSPLVIFVDEIDTTINLDFTDDFFAAIRYFYVARAQDIRFERLSFVLIGVATPGDLIRDPKRTPFNIGQRLDLTDFTVDEAMPLAQGLGLAREPAQQLLRWVLEWTGGHPYLTQRLCSVISEQDKDSWSSAAVKQVVSSTFFGAMSQQDHNLQFVRDMLTKRAPDKYEVLSVYLQIRLGKRPVFDEEHSIIKSHLKLSGVVWRKDNALRLRNRIYEQVFDRRWINENLPFSLSDRWYRRAMLYGCVPANLNLLVAIATRFFGNGVIGLAGAFAVILPSIITLLQVSSALTKFGKEGFEKILNELKIPLRFQEEVRFASTLLMSWVLLGFWLSLPQVSKIYNRNGIINYRHGKLGAAEQNYLQAISLNTDNFEAHYNLGNVYEDLQNLDKAQKHYQIAVKGELPQAYNNLAYLYIQNKQYSQAVVLLKRVVNVVEKTDNLPEVTYSLYKNFGWVRFKQSRYEEAQEYLQLAIEIAQDSQKSAYIGNLGSAYCLLAQVQDVQKTGTGIEQWQKCYQLADTNNPNEDEWLHLAKKRLKKVGVKCEKVEKSTVSPSAPMAR